MPDAPTDQATRLLGELCDGDESAAERLMPLVYHELRELAGRLFQQQRSGHTLQPTALVHEAYLKLVRQQDASFDSRAHFLAVAAKAMRQILIDRARRKQTEKHGGQLTRITLHDDSASASEQDVDLLALNEVLERLAQLDERKARIVELRFFGGLNMEETAAALNVSRATASEDWRIARAWIAKELGEEPAR